jgi:hypothetical protein
VTDDSRGRRFHGEEVLGEKVSGTYSDGAPLTQEIVPSSMRTTRIDLVKLEGV